MFADLTPNVKLFLILFTLSYFVVGADLCKEMAKEKDEIGFFTAIIEESIHVDNSSILILLETVPKVSESIPQVSYTIHSTDLELFPPARSPPSA